MTRIVLCIFAASQLLFAAATAHGVAPVHSWSKRFGAALPNNNSEGGEDVAVDGSGNVIMTGYFQGIQNFGGADLDNGPGWGVLLAKYAADGTHLWSKNFPSGTGDAVAVDGSNNIIVTGKFYGTTNFGGADLTSTGGADAFIAKYAADGTHLWSQDFGSYYDAWGISVATDGSDNVFVLSYGADAFDEYVIVTKFDPSGAPSWNHAFAGPHIGSSIVVDGSGSVTIAGDFLGTVNYGGSDLNSVGTGPDIFVARFDPSGTHLWSQRFGGTNSDFGPALAVDASANIWMTGWFYQTANFGGADLVSAGNSDIFVATYDSSGAHLRSYRYGGVSSAVALSVAVDGSGNATVTGWFGGSADFGGGPLVSNAGDVFLAQYDATGAHIWSQRFGGTSPDYGVATAVDGSGAAFVMGNFYGTTNFGGDDLVSAGGADIFLARFAEINVPVLISHFEASARDGVVAVRWEVSSDEALESYTLNRSDANSQLTIAQGPFDQVTRSFLDTNVLPDKTYRYELAIYSPSGHVTRSQAVNVTMPRLEAELKQNFPNPFNPSTTIEYTLNERARVVIRIYDTAGRTVARLDQGIRPAGNARIEWNGRDASGEPVASGVYFYQLEGAARHLGSRKMVLLK